MVKGLQQCVKTAIHNVYYAMKACREQLDKVLLQVCQTDSLPEDLDCLVHSKT